MTRHTGVLVPLFSAASSRSWGAGELPDLVPLAAWLVSAGFDRLMILPIGPRPPGERSPYGAMSSMAIDPFAIALDDVSDFARAGGAGALSDEGREALAAARRSATVPYDAIARAKTEALDLAFARFARDEWEGLTPRAADLAAYIARERWWLDDFALYRALARASGLAGWRDWPPPLRDRSPGALDEARRALARDVLREQYLQWIAESQWHLARRDARARGVTVFGDLPFMVSADGPEVWTRPDEVIFDESLGVPPDAFSSEGQDWGLPVYRWDRIAATGYVWMRQRARRIAALYDGYRIDHLVGLYRTYSRPRGGGAPRFRPADEAAQVQQGETLVGIHVDTGARIIAEDLGLVPDFVRASLARLGVPGSKVLRWERAWSEPGQPFLDPRAYPTVSAAMTGTHDTDTLAGWWTGADADERSAFADLVRRMGGALDPGAPWSPAVHDAILRVAYHAASAELFLPIQDVFGWRARINVPGTIGDHNWTWKLPWPVDRMTNELEAAARAAACRTMGRT